MAVLKTNVPLLPAEISTGGFTGPPYARTVQHLRLLTANGPDCVADRAFEQQSCRIARVFGGLTDLLQSARDAGIALR